MHEQILDALRRGAIAEALEAARLAVAADPDDAAGHHLLALALRLSGDHDAALAAVDRALELAPEDPGLHFQRASVLLGSRDLAAAPDALARAVELDPNQIESCLTQAHIALGHGNVDEAERLANLASQVDPGHPSLAAVEGLVSMHRGQGDAGIRRVSGAIERTPEDPVLKYALGLLYFGKQHWAFAEQAFRGLLERDADNRPLYPLVADLMARQGREEEAADFLQPLLDDTERQTSGLLRLAARLDLAANRVDKAMDRLRSALAHAPNDRMVLQLLLSLWQRDGQLDEARRTLESALATTTDAADLWRSRLAIESGDQDAARAVLERWMRAMPDALPALEAQMGFELASGEGERAERLARRIVEKQPGHLRAQDVIVGRLQKQDLAAAIAHVEALLADAKSDDARILLKNWLGRLLDTAGRHQDAVVQWTDVARIQLPRQLPLSPVSLPPERVPAGPWPAVAENPQAPRPLFLWGPPGSGVERIAAVLAASPGFLGDRFSPRGVRDGFQAFSSVEGLSLGRIDTASFVQDWRAALTARGARDPNVIEWLMWWDNAFLRILRPHLPGAAVLVVVRDPRDMLIEWLAFGAPSRMGFPSPLHAARWLLASLLQVEALVAGRLQPAAVIKIDGIENDPAALAARLNEVLKAELPVPSRPGPTFFPAGHWRNYAEPLAEAFAELTPLAVRFGYDEH